MLEVKNVVQIAKQYIADIFSEDGGHRPLLEEVRHTSQSWEVVVSIAPAPEFSTSIVTMAQEPKRRFKKLHIDDTGNVMDVAIYNP